MRTVLWWVSGVLIAFFVQSVTVEATELGGLRLSKTRMIFSSANKAAALSVKNMAAHPWLIQVQILDEHEKETPLFVVLPPLFRMDAWSDNQIRVLISSDSQTYPKDREGLWFLHVMAIPPVASSGTDDPVKGGIRIGIENVIKLIYRPEVMAEPDDAIYKQVHFLSTAEGIHACNLTRYYLSFSSLTFDEVSVDLNRYPSMLAPLKCELYKQQGHSAKWSMINDYGGASSVFSAEVKNK